MHLYGRKHRNRSFIFKTNANISFFKDHFLGSAASYANFFLFVVLECTILHCRIRVQILHCRIRVHNRLLCSLWGLKFFSVLLIVDPYFLHCKNVNRYDKKYLFIQKSSLSVAIHKHGKSGGKYIAIALNLRLSINC